MSYIWMWHWSKPRKHRLLWLECVSEHGNKDEGSSVHVSTQSWKEGSERQASCEELWKSSSSTYTHSLFEDCTSGSVVLWFLEMRLRPRLKGRRRVGGGVNREEWWEKTARDGGRHLQSWRVGRTPYNYLHPLCQPEPVEWTDAAASSKKRELIHKQKTQHTNRHTCKHPQTYKRCVISQAGTPTHKHTLTHTHTHRDRAYYGGWVQTASSAVPHQVSILKACNPFPDSLSLSQSRSVFSPSVPPMQPSKKKKRSCCRLHNYPSGE